MSRFACSIRAILPFVTIMVAGVLSGCGDDAPPESPQQSASLPSGHFVDSYVQGLGYVSGSTTGSTGADGKFIIESTTDVSFAVGDIDLGTGAPAHIMSPLNLVLGALDVTNPTVTNHCRFLQTIDNDGNPGNGIVITPAVVAAAAGQSINFQQDTGSFENDANVQSVVSALTAATAAGERTLVSAATAQAQLSSGIRAAYVGSNAEYNGDFCVDQQSGQIKGGTWAMEVDANGAVSIGFDGTPTFIATGTMDLLGNVTATAPGGVEVYATFDPDFGGRWYAGETSGSFSESADCGH